MQKTTFGQMNTIIDDLESLIVEIENNPSISSWVLRMTLKSIKDKAVKMATDTSQTQAYLEELACLN